MVICDWKECQCIDEFPQHTYTSGNHYHKWHVNKNSNPPEGFNKDGDLNNG